MHAENDHQPLRLLPQSALKVANDTVQSLFKSCLIEFSLNKIHVRFIELFEVLNPQLRPPRQTTKHLICVIEFTPEKEVNDVHYGGRHHAQMTALTSIQGLISDYLNDSQIENPEIQKQK